MENVFRLLEQAAKCRFWAKSFTNRNDPAAVAFLKIAEDLEAQAQALLRERSPAGFPIGEFAT
jgi:hypothetical protein